MTSTRRFLAACALAAVLAAFAPVTALACPSCAGNNRGAVGKVVALGAMILLPFAIVGIALPALKRPAGDPHA